MLPTPANSPLIGVEDNSEAFDVATFQPSVHKIEELAIALFVVNFEHARNAAPAQDRVDNVSVVLAFDEQNAFAGHYRTSILSRVTIANSSFENVTAL